MACPDDNSQPNFKHYCRVCKRGFMCGRALGGHMRAHGIGDENVTNLDDDDEDDQACDWDDDHRNNNKRRMYKLRTNPNRFKNCEHCGEEFVSWKSFLEHGKCAYEDGGSESLLSLQDSDDDDDDGRGVGRQGRPGWSKRKRSMRSEVSSGENDDFLLAACLVQLANTVVDLPSEREESCASASREEEMRMNNARKTPALDKGKGVVCRNNNNNINNKGLFECKACKKVFNSHQALGGHRASHKKVKGCYAARQDQLEDVDPTNPQEDDAMGNNETLYFSSKETASHQVVEPGPTSNGPARRKSKVHECSICHRVFSSGQALGGHKRCHWITSNSLDTTSPLQKLSFQPQEDVEKPKVEYNAEQFNLNVPAWDNMSGLRRDPINPLSFDVPTGVDLKPCSDDDVEDKGSNRDSRQIRPRNEASERLNVEEGEETNARDKVEDEADSSLKSAKVADLNDLKDMKASADSSKWLQVGICSAAAEDDKSTSDKEVKGSHDCSRTGK